MSTEELDENVLHFKIMSLLNLSGGLQKKKTLRMCTRCLCQKSTTACFKPPFNQPKHCHYQHPRHSDAVGDTTVWTLNALKIESCGSTYHLCTSHPAVSILKLSIVYTHGIVSLQKVKKKKQSHQPKKKPNPTLVAAPTKLIPNLSSIHTESNL